VVLQTFLGVSPRSTADVPAKSRKAAEQPGNLKAPTNAPDPRRTSYESGLRDVPPDLRADGFALDMDADGIMAHANPIGSKVPWHVAQAGFV